MFVHSRNNSDDFKMPELPPASAAVAEMAGRAERALAQVNLAAAAEAPVQELTDLDITSGPVLLDQEAGAQACAVLRLDPMGQGDAMLTDKTFGQIVSLEWSQVELSDETPVEVCFIRLDGTEVNFSGRDVELLYFGTPFGTKSMTIEDLPVENLADWGRYIRITETEMDGNVNTWTVDQAKEYVPADEPLSSHRVLIVTEAKDTMDGSLVLDGENEGSDSDL